MHTSATSSHYIFNNKSIHYVVLSLLLLVTLYGLTYSFTRGVANAWYFNAEFSLNDWAGEKSIRNLEEYKHGLNSIEKAHSLDPTHPHYVHMLGRIKHWGVDMGFEDKEQLQDIHQWYLLATELRSIWPDPWVDLLRLNNYLYGYNADTKYYIQQALVVGPYIDLVTQGTIQVWLLNWDKLSGKERAALFKQFEIATKQYFVLEHVLKSAKAINRENLLCSQLKYNPDYENIKSSHLYRKYCLK
ncbi:VpsP family polysaccharide biosynthesis protein [Colwellia echini]|uniref:Uncharacterized protein n=1 Tax=Colwellia echini TaxID=1982103 RepID=A0ABY3MUC3_9GAMM|nr:VpsP family polysaccharide biosynthesis protein [Colwellia echini]TYK64785.1 hypothetical protein CWS31_013915 [Colwellia echini]